MTMECQDASTDTDSSERDRLINYLTNNEQITFKSQQRGEADLTKQEKTDIALDIFHQSKLRFLVRFGKHLQREHLGFFQQFTHGCEDASEIDLVLRDLLVSAKKDVKNRRFGALMELVEQDSYFSDVEMMKRSPLLYDQLVGQYLSEDEKRERDRAVVDQGATLVKVLMEGIERDDAEIKRKEQEGCENMEGDEDDEDSDSKGGVDGRETPEPSYSQWGEFQDEQVVIKPKKRVKVAAISMEEQKLLREEFVTSMYQSFLEGKDEDFDYASVDNNDKYDNYDMKECDEEDKYFDSEEPATVPIESLEESEDELDIFMSGLDRDPSVNKLTKDMHDL